MLTQLLLDFAFLTVSRTGASEDMRPSAPPYFRLDGMAVHVNPSALVPMTSHEIFRECSAEVVNEVFAFLQDREKTVYRAVIQNIATQRKLRPVFIERKPKAERYEWLRQVLSRKAAADVAAQTLQIWLLGAQRDLICQFLDALEIPHDGKGFVDKLPSEPSREKLDTAVGRLLERYRPEIVAVYLHLFQTMDDAGWKGLEEILTSDRRLKIGRASEPETNVTG